MNHTYTLNMYFEYQTTETQPNIVTCDACALIGLAAHDRVNRAFYLSPEFFDGQEYSIPRFEDFDGDIEGATPKEGYDCFTSSNRIDSTLVVYDTSAFPRNMSKEEIEKLVHAYLWDAVLIVEIHDETGDCVFSWSDYILKNWCDIREEIIERAIGDIIVNESWDDEDELRKCLDKAIPETIDEITCG